MAKPEVKSVYVPDRAALRAWLERHHASHGAVWLVYDKKPTGGARALTYDAIVEEALCFGWIDSVVGKVDESRARLYFSPRKPGSVWSALNKRRVDALEKAGLMAQPGRAKIMAAKRDGSWDALNAVAEVDRGKLPTDLERALARVRGAAGHFAAFPPGVRRQCVQWIITAKRAETRAERVAITAAMAGANRRASDPAARKAFVQGSTGARADSPNTPGSPNTPVSPGTPNATRSAGKPARSGEVKAASDGSRTARAHGRPKRSRG